MTITAMEQPLADLLRRQHACADAAEWAAPYATLAEAWAVCPRADWMLWLAGRLSGDGESATRKRLVLCACACARVALKHVPEGETRPLRAIETAEQWARGETGVTLADVRAAAYAADASAADAADAAAAAAADAWRATRARVLAELADVVREHYPSPPEEQA